jgi:Na+/proline symporter
MAACKDERNSMLATLWYQVAHYCVRPWPWLIVAFAALAMYPELRAGELVDRGFNSGVGFPMVMRDLSKPGLSGLLIVTFFAAFMSTLSTQMNWGASYLVRDVYQRFMRPQAGDKELTAASRYASLIVLVAGAIASVFMANMSVDAAWKLLLALGAGTGAVFMLRWFWWRINAWSEISSMLGSLVFFLAYDSVVISIAGEEELKAGVISWAGVDPALSEVKMLVVAVLTIVLWLLVTLLTRPESKETLDAFYRKVHPGGPFWKPVADRNPDVEADRDVGLSIIAAFCATGIVYSTIPCIGNIIFQHYEQAIGCGAAAIGFTIIVGFLLKRLLKNLNTGANASTTDPKV